MTIAKVKAIIAAVGMVLIAGGVACIDWRFGVVSLGVLLLWDARTPTSSPERPEL